MRCCGARSARRHRWRPSATPAREPVHRGPDAAAKSTVPRTVSARRARRRAARRGRRCLGLGAPAQRLAARARQPHAFVGQHLGDERLDAVDVDVAAGQRRRVDHEEGLPDARPVAFVDEEATTPRSRSARPSARRRAARRRARASRPFVAAPIGSIEPSSAACASVVGRPSLSSAQPCGIGSPFFARRPRSCRARLRTATRSIISGSRVPARKDRRDRVRAEDRVPAAGGRHRRRRIREAEPDEAGGREPGAGDRPATPA